MGRALLKKRVKHYNEELTDLEARYAIANGYYWLVSLGFLEVIGGGLLALVIDSQINYVKTGEYSYGLAAKICYFTSAICLFSKVIFMRPYLDDRKLCGYQLGVHTHGFLHSLEHESKSKTYEEVHRNNTIRTVVVSLLVIFFAWYFYMIAPKWAKMVNN